MIRRWCWQFFGERWCWQSQRTPDWSPKKIKDVNQKKIPEYNSATSRSMLKQPQKKGMPKQPLSHLHCNQQGHGKTSHNATTCLNQMCQLPLNVQDVVVIPDLHTRIAQHKALMQMHWSPRCQSPGICHLDVLKSCDQSCQWWQNWMDLGFQHPDHIQARNDSPVMDRGQESLTWCQIHCQWSTMSSANCIKSPESTIYNQDVNGFKVKLVCHYGKLPKCVPDIGRTQQNSGQGPLVLTSVPKRLRRYFTAQYNRRSQQTSGTTK